MSKYRYNVSGMHCANCAKKLENYLSNQEDFSNVSVNFNTCKLAYESDKEFTLKELNKMAKAVESDFTISSIDEHHHDDFHITTLIMSNQTLCL